MDRKKLLESKPSSVLYHSLLELYNELDVAFENQFSRSLPFSEAVFDRWQRAEKLGFGDRSSIYNSSLVFGDVKVGADTWIGPFTIIDGTGGLSIGHHCTISAGVHIYTHDNIGRTVTGGKTPIEHDSVKIGNCTYIAPNVIIQKGVSIGSHCIVGANSFVSRSIPDFSVAAGSPAKVIGRVVVDGGQYRIEYSK